MTAKVLGTAIAALPGDPARPCYLLSDLHVPADGGRPVAMLDALLRCAAAERARVFVLGDLFDSYVSAAQVRVGVWREIAQRFAAAAAAGCDLAVLPGNRDFLLGAEFAAAGRLDLVTGGIRTRLGAFDALLLHGDELCLDDLPYQRAKRWLRARPVRWLARRLPLRLALAVAARARRRSAMVIQRGDPARFAPTAAALATAFQSGAGLLVFGHIHQPARGRIGAQEYCVLPAFDAAGIAIRIHGADLRYVDCGSGAPERRPDPPAGRFA